MKKLAMILLGSTMMVAAPAMAQDMSNSSGVGPMAPRTSTTTPAPAPTAGATAITDAEVTQFAKAVVAIDAIQRDANIPTDQKQAQMAAKVEEQGLEPVKFNAIAQTAQTDPTLQTKVQAAIQAEAATTPATN